METFPGHFSSSALLQVGHLCSHVVSGELVPRRYPWVHVPVLPRALALCPPFFLPPSLSLLLHTGSVTEPGAGTWEIQAHSFKTLQLKKEKLFQAAYS